MFQQAINESTDPEEKQSFQTVVDDLKRSSMAP
jgi:hypothetical protein